MATTAGQGLVYTSDTAKSALLSSNRDYNNRLTWQNLYNANDVAAAQAENSLVKSYTDASASAYVSYLQNQNAIKNSSIVGSGKQSLIDDAYSSWQSTLASYQSSLSSGLSSISESKEEADAVIDEALEEQADYTAQYVNAHYSYLEALYEQYEAGENTLFDEGSQWYKYLTTDEDGNVSLKSWEDLTAAAWEELENEDGTITKEYTSLFDEDGNLTIAGVDFFDQLENQIANEGGYSWGDYLLETNEDLYNWANSYNAYNYTQDGTNAGTMRTMFGMMSTDYAYSFAERFGGLTSSQIDDLFADFYSAYESLGSTEKGDISDVQDLVSSFKSMADSLGITSDLEEELGMSFDTLAEVLQAYYDGSYSDADEVLTVLTGSAVGMAVGAGSGAAFGSVAGPVVSGIMAIFGGIVGLFVGATNAFDAAEAQELATAINATEAKKLFNELLISMTNYATYKKNERTTNLELGLTY